MGDPAPTFYQWEGDALILRLKVQPRASRDELAEAMGDRLKIRITAPPAEGQANAHLVKFLARLFKVPQANVELLSGATGRDKRLRIRAPQQLPPGIPPR